MPGDQGAVTHFEKIAGTEAADKRVPVSGSNIGAPRNDFVAVSGFFDFDAANAVEASGERRREALGHMLNGDDSRTILRHLFENLEQSFCASCGGADGDNLFPLLRRLRQDNGRNHNIGGMMARGIFAEPAKFAYAGSRCSANGIFEQNGGFFEEPTDPHFRFSDDIHRSDFQSADGRFGSGAGEFRTNDDRHRILGHDLL